MNHATDRIRLLSAALATACSLAIPAFALAQPPAPAAAPPTVVSPEVLADRRIAFRLYAPKAEAVRLMGTDIPGNTQGAAMTKADNGVWEATLGPVDAGAYRYVFSIDDVRIVDPRNPNVSGSNDNVWSLVTVPGSDVFDTKNVPHGAVAAVTYYSSALSRFRRMHVYTPPGYESGTTKYPVFYLLHGAGDNDDAWSSVGRAGIILDNLIADKKAIPMIVVMPAGHTRSGGFRQPAPGDEFSRDFLEDIVPYIEQHYRVLTDRPNRAIAGLSMGGNQTLDIGIPHLDKFAYVGVFSSGLIGTFPPARPAAPGAPAPAAAPPPDFTWERTHARELDDAALKSGLKLFWFATGKEDFLLKTTNSTVELFKKHGFNPVFVESAGGHTWINWRNYLTEFAPKLFK